MIEPQNIQETLYTNNPSLGNKEPIRWLIDGEDPTGAPYGSEFDNSGILNRVSSQIFKNTEIIDNNVKTIKIDFDEAVDLLNAHETILGELGDTTLSQEVSDLNTVVGQHEVRLGDAENSIQLNQDGVSVLTTLVGEKPADDMSSTTLAEASYYYRQQIGNYSDYDIYGNPDLDNPASGMKAVLENNSASITDFTTRIEALEGYNIDSLSDSVDDIRTELGPTPGTITNTIYTRISDNEENISINSSDITDINEFVGNVVTPEPASLAYRVNSLEGDVSNLDLQINDTGGINDRLGVVETEINDTVTTGTIAYKVATLETNYSSLLTVVGEDETSGLQLDVANLNNEVFTTDTGLVDRTSTLETDLSSTTSTVNDLSTRVGSNVPGSETGLTLDVVTLQDQQLQSEYLGGFTSDTNITATSVTTQGTYVPVVIDTVTELPEANGASLTGSVIDTTSMDGRFNVIASIDATTTATGTASFVVYKNGVATVAKSLVALENGLFNVTINCPITVSPGDSLELQATITDGIGDFTVENATFFVSK